MKRHAGKKGVNPQWQPFELVRRDLWHRASFVVNECFYEKVIKVKADVAALLIFLVLCGFRHISAETFALGSLRSDD